MSFTLMAKAMEVNTGSCITKMVLMKLCDNANDAGEAWPSHATIAEHCEISKSTVKTHINKLIEMGHISKEARVINGNNSSNMYKIHLATSGSGAALGGSGAALGGSGAGYKPTNKPINESTKKDTKVSKKPSISPDEQEVLDYLNSKTGKNHRAPHGLASRFKEGYTVEDAKQVIDTKCSQWLEDEKMSAYLRPKTLFSNNFDGYLNENPPKKKFSELTRDEWNAMDSDTKYDNQQKLLKELFG